MRRADLTVEYRSDSGKGVARKLRAAGKIPGVLYGEKKEPQALAVDAYDFGRLVARGGEGLNVMITLKAQEGDSLSMIKDLQYEPVKGDVLHVDFVRISQDSKITTEVPLHLEGTPQAVREGGVLEAQLRYVEIESFPQDIPDYIEIDVSQLNMGETLHVSDLPKAEKYEITSDPDQAVASIISAARLEAAAEQMEAAAAELEAASGGAEPAEGAEKPAAEGAAGSEETASAE